MMDLSAQSQKTIVQVIGADCFHKLKFNNVVHISTKITILVDELTEYEYVFEHTFNRNEESLYQMGNKTSSPVVLVESGTQTDNQHALITSHDIITEVKIEPESEDGISDPLHEESHVLPQSMPHEILFITPATDRDSPNLPSATTHHSAAAETESPSTNHDIANQYNCPICEKVCHTVIDLSQHVTTIHCKNEDRGLSISETASKKRRQKPKSKKPADNGSDTDEDYMKNENIVIKIKKKKKVIVATSKHSTSKLKADKAKKTKRKTAHSVRDKRKKEKAISKSSIMQPKSKIIREQNQSREEEAIDEDDFNDVDDSGDEEEEVKAGKNIADKSFKSAEGKVKCSKCGKEYKSRRALRRHFSTIHEDREHVCEICGNSFKGKESLYHHKRGVHENLKVYKCPEPGCDQSFNFSHSLRLHRLKHSGARPHMCNVCGKTYLTAYHLKVHAQATHSEKKNFACKICNKLFSYSTSLKMHEATHNKVERVKCESCTKTFVNQQALKYHVMSKHTEPGHFPCEVCGKICNSKLLLRNHQKRHTTDSSRFMCDICGRQFMYKSALDMHRAIHQDEKAYMCKLCNKTFKTYPTLYSHQYVHRQDSPFTCATCGKSFKTKERLKAHEKRHAGLKPFKCMICQHCFPDNGGLSKHMRTVHCKVKKFVCDICGKATSRADNLRVHMKVHSKDTEYKPKQPREPKSRKVTLQNIPAVVQDTFDANNKKSTSIIVSEFFQDNSEDSHSNTESQFVANGFDGSLPFTTLDSSQIAVSTADHNIPLNLQHNQGTTAQAPVWHAPDQSEHTNRVNVASVAGTAANIVQVPSLQAASQYLYTWPYVYPHGIQPQTTTNSNSFFQQ